MRRALTVILLAGIVAAAAWTLFAQRTKSPAADPWRAVPSMAPLVIEIGDPLARWDRWTHSSRWWQVIAGTDVARRIDTVAVRLSERAEADPSFAREMAAPSLLIALFPAANSGIDALFIWNMPEGNPLNAVREALKGTGVTVAAQAGLVMAASDANILAEAQRTLTQPIVDRPVRSAAARATLGRDADAHILADVGALPRLVGALLAPSAVEELGLDDGWVALDVSVRPETILLSGLHRPGAPVKNDTSAVAVPSLARSLPASVCTFAFHSLGDPGSMATTASEAQPDELHALVDWCDGRAMIAHTPPDTAAGLTWAVLGTIDPELTWRSLASLCDSNGCDTMRYREQLLTHLERGSVFERTLGRRWWKVERPWFAVLGDEVVFCDDVNGIKQSVDAWIEGTGLAGDMRIVDFMQQNAIACTSVQWWHGSRGRALLAANATGALQASMAASPAIIGSTGNVLLMRSPAGNGDEFMTLVIGTDRPAAIATEAIAAMPAAAGTVPDALWSLDLPAAPARKPFIVKNHMNGTREVLVQDQQHSIHLVSAAGGLQWSRTLDGPILGEVRQVDRFRNGKLQLLFNTAGSLYLVDRNGKDVQGFPVKVKDGCSAALAVFDYENTRDYRIVLPTEEGGLVNLDMDGRPVEGWAPPRLASVSNEAVRFVRARGKDHLLVFEGTGTIHVLGRRGEVRYAPDLSMKGLAEVLDVKPGASIGATRITWRDKEGRVWRATLDATERTLLAARTDRAVSAELGGAQRIIRSSGDTLVFIGSKGTATNVRLTGGISDDPATYDLGPRWLIAVRAGDGVHLLDAEGTERMPSPLTSAVLPSIADLDLDGRFELVTGSGTTGIAAFRLP